jgi:hypothetical protein
VPPNSSRDAVGERLQAIGPVEIADDRALRRGASLFFVFRFVDHTCSAPHRLKVALPMVAQ